MFASHFASLIFLRAYKDAQSKQRSIMVDIRKNTKAVSRMEKTINEMKRTELNSIRANKNIARYSVDEKIFAREGFEAYLSNGEINFEAMKKDGAYQAYLQLQAQQYAEIEEDFKRQEAELERWIEWKQETELEPLRELGEDLEIDKANADMEVETAKASYEASKKMAQENTKNMWA